MCKHKFNLIVFPCVSLHDERHSFLSRLEDIFGAVMEQIPGEIVPLVFEFIDVVNAWIPQDVPPSEPPDFAARAIGAYLASIQDDDHYYYD